VPAQDVLLVTKIKHHSNVVVSQVLHEDRDMISTVDLQAACKMPKSSHRTMMLPVGIHLPTEKVGCQKLRGQNKIEMRYWIQL
jgi:hypothetical protein